MKKIQVLALVLFMLGCGSAGRNGGLIRVVDNYQDGDYQDAIRIADRVLQQYEYEEEGQALILYYKAMSLEAIGDTGVAIALYRFISDKHGDSQYGYAAAERLATIRSAEPE